LGSGDGEAFLFLDFLPPFFPAGSSSFTTSTGFCSSGGGAGSGSGDGLGVFAHKNFVLDSFSRFNRL
jgi:hypothetical protein